MRGAAWNPDAIGDSVGVNTMRLVRDRIPRSELDALAAEGFGDMVKRSSTSGATSW